MNNETVQHIEENSVQGHDSLKLILVVLCFQTSN